MNTKDLNGIIKTIERIGNIHYDVEKLENYIDFNELSNLYAVYSAAHNSTYVGLKSNGHGQNIENIYTTLCTIQTVFEELDDNDLPFAVEFVDNEYDEQLENCHALSRAVVYLNVFYVDCIIGKRRFINVQDTYYLRGSGGDDHSVYLIPFETFLDNLVDDCERAITTLTESLNFIERKYEVAADSKNDLSEKAQKIEDTIFSLPKQNIDDELFYLERIKELCSCLKDLYDRLVIYPLGDRFMAPTMIKRSDV